MDPQWQKFIGEEISKPYMQELIAFIKQRRTQTTVTPAPDKVFEAFNLCPYHTLSAVIYDYEPDINPGATHGLAYSSLLPYRSRSLRNIFCEASRLPESDMLEIYTHNNLTHWAKQGILLLNFNMTGEEKIQYAHFGKGWKQFQINLIEFLNGHPNRLTFMLWGKPIQDALKGMFNEKHLILTSDHPSGDLENWAYNCHFLTASLFSQYESRRDPGPDLNEIRWKDKLEKVQMGQKLDWGL